MEAFWPQREDVRRPRPRPVVHSLHCLSTPCPLSLPCPLRVRSMSTPCLFGPCPCLTLDAGRLFDAGRLTLDAAAPTHTLTHTRSIGTSPTHTHTTSAALVRGHSSLAASRHPSSSSSFSSSLSSSHSSSRSSSHCHSPNAIVGLPHSEGASTTAATPPSSHHAPCPCTPSALKGPLCAAHAIAVARRRSLPPVTIFCCPCP
jgi:hypothetical protein